MYSAGGEKKIFLTLPLQENYIPPTHRKNDRECIVLQRARGLDNCIIKFLAKRNTEFYVQFDW